MVIYNIDKACFLKVAFGAADFINMRLLFLSAFHVLPLVTETGYVYYPRATEGLYKITY